MIKISKNSVSLAGEFAALSQLVLRGYDANLTLGHTKGVDILVSDPKSDKMFKVEVKTSFASKPSRSKIELLFECPRCFWLYTGKGISRPFGAPYTINNAADFLLKKEFDEHRKNGTAHYLIEREGIDAIPFMHHDIDKWRNTFTGIQYHHPATDFLIFGAVDGIDNI